MNALPFFRHASRAAPIVFSLSLAGLGLAHAIFGESLARLFPVWPQALFGRPFLAHVLGVLILAGGTMALLRIRPTAGALLCGAIMLASVLGIHLPRSIPTGFFGDEWLNVFKWAAMSLGAVAFAFRFRRDSRASTISLRTHQVALVAFCVFLATASYAHFKFAEFVAMMVPAWMPQRTAWAYITGAALLAGGIGMLLPKTRVLAGSCVALMIFLWFALLHTPHALAAPSSPVGWSEMAESLGFASLALLLASRKNPASAD